MGSEVTAAPSQTDDTPEAALDRLERLGGRSLVRRMVELFAGAAGARVDTIRDGAEAGPREIQMVAHSLKTSAGLVGAARLLELASETEAVAARGSHGQLEALTSRLCGEFDQAVETVTRLVAEREEPS